MLAKLAIAGLLKIKTFPYKGCHIKRILHITQIISKSAHATKFTKATPALL